MRPFAKRRAGWRRRERLARAEALLVEATLSVGWVLLGIGVVMAVLGR